jgi:Penicillin binding protein transpeptidase domain/NTF2-like N-terminal transpeptidase domain/Penicillin-binding Protein dimerisation domain
MASTRRRGAHAAAGPKPAVGGSTPSSAGTGGTGGMALSSLRARLTPLRVVLAVLVLGFGTVLLTGGLWSSPSAEPTVQQFLLAWQQHSYASAAALTTGNVAQVKNELAHAYSRLDAAAFYLNMGKIRQSGGTATAHFTASVDLGQDGAPWTYNGQFTLRRVGPGWKIVWSPSVINPGLAPGLRLAVISTTRDRMPLLDAEGQPLQTPSTAVVVGVRPYQLKDPAATADALGRATGIEPSEVLGWILAAPRKPFLELVTFRPAEYHRLAHKLRKVPGLISRQRRVLLFNSVAPAVVGSVGAEASTALRDAGIAYRPGATVGLSGLQSRYQAYLAGTPRTEVVAETASGRTVRVLKTWEGRSPVPVHTTINGSVQQAAARAVASAPGSAAIVAMQASTGRILAVADRKARGIPRIDPLAGRYPPGGAFIIVSAEALLAKGMPVNTTIPCNQVNSVGGRNFRNVPQAKPEPGATFATDFAHSCATALAGLSQGLTAAELTKAAEGFGFGRTWQLPLAGFSGAVGSANGVAGLAAATVGQGNVRVSPLTMADVAAQVATGSWHEPSLVTRPPDAQQSRRSPFGMDTLASLRSLMRAAVASGAASGANVGGQPVYGQVGTTLLSSGKHQKWATWFVGYRGDIAFAVLEFSGSSHTSAAPLAASFLRSAPAR